MMIDQSGRIRRTEDVEGMIFPVRCRCGNVHDGAKATVVQRYSDCSVWKCPGCGVLIDDRPNRWGGVKFLT